MSSNNIQQSTLPKVKKHLSIKKRIIIAVIAIVIVTAGVLTWLYLNNYFSNRPVVNKQDLAIVASQTAVSSIISGDYNGGQKALDGSLSNATNPKDQAWIYIQKASVALNLNKYTEAYDFASQAEKLSPDVNSAQMLAAAAAKKGDNADAIAKYELAISRITGKSGMDKLDIQTMQDEINRLKG